MSGRNMQNCIFFCLFRLKVWIQSAMIIGFYCVRKISYVSIWFCHPYHTHTPKVLTAIRLQWHLWVWKSFSTSHKGLSILNAWTWEHPSQPSERKGLKIVQHKWKSTAPLKGSECSSLTVKVVLSHCLPAHRSEVLVKLVVQMRDCTSERGLGLLVRLWTL